MIRVWPRQRRVRRGEPPRAPNQPAPILTAAECRRLLQLTAEEAVLVRQGVGAVLEYDAIMLAREPGTRRGRFYKARTAADIMAPLQWRRQAELFALVLLEAREAGALLQYQRIPKKKNGQEPEAPARSVAAA